MRSYQRLARWMWLVGAVAGFARSGQAAVMTDRYEASARFAVQNTFQHDGVDQIDWVQERNEFRFDLRYDLFPSGSGGWWIFDRIRPSLLYRARYDSIFDIRDVYGRRGFRRDDFRFPEGKLPREAFVDIVTKSPLSMRIGRQQVVWGEADLFRSLDVVNPLRLDQQGLIGDDFSDYREPLWIAKFLYNTGQLGSWLADTNLEFFYSPNSRPLTDRIIVSEGFRLGVDENVCSPNSPLPCKRPQALPFRRTRHPWEVSRVGPYRTDAGNQADLNPVDATNGTHCTPNSTDPLHNGCGDFVYLLDNDWPTNTVDLEASMAGVRFMGKTLGGLDFSLNYLFKRTEVPGTALKVSDLFCPAGDPEDPTGTFCRGDGQPNPRPSLLTQAATAMANGTNDDLIRRCVGGEPLIILTNMHGATPYDTSPTGSNQPPDSTVNGFTGCEKVQFWYPWTHIIGATATYNDYDYTGFIWRLEESFSTREPRTNHTALAAERSGDYPRTKDFATHFKRDTQVWRSMFGFDYLKTPFPNLPGWVRQQWWSTFLKDQWFFTFQFFNEYYSHTDEQLGLLDSLTDRMYHWNPVLTYLMTGFFHHELFRPTIAAGLDVNQMFPVLWVQGEYHLSPRLVMRFGDIEYFGSQNAESFIFLHKYADRDNLYLRFTFYLI